MQVVSVLKKMMSVLTSPVSYSLETREGMIGFTELIGRKVKIEFTGKINCIACGKSIPKTYGQGFCYPCFTNLPENEECVLHPELCRAHLGIARDMEYAKKHCLSPQIVYLSYTSGLKVGVTRLSQKPTRWIDQGAVAAISLALTENRFQAGLIEVTLKNFLADKTNWREMLKEVSPGVDLVGEKAKFSEFIPVELKKFYCQDMQICNITYPVMKYPEKPVSHNFDKCHILEGTLLGIKGQYLLFDNQKVLNIRNYTGYIVRLDI